MTAAGPTSTTSGSPVALSSAPSGVLTGVAVPPPSSTPRLLRRFQVLAALALVFLGALSALVITDLRSDLATAPGLADQYARLGQVQAALIEAGTTARQGVIAGNGGPSSQADVVGAQLGTASGLLVEAARARPQDAEALVEISDNLVQYGHLLRAADGRDASTAAKFLSRADTQLDEQLLPALADLQTALRTEAASRPWSQSEILVPVLAVAVLAGLVWISWIVARLSRRVLNVGLVAAFACTLVVAWVTLAGQQYAGEASERSRGANFGEVAALTDSINQVSTAQRLQTTAVLQRRWRPADADQLKTTLAHAKQQSPSSAAQQLAQYQTASHALTTLMAKADWAGAEKALAGTADTTVNGAAAEFVSSVDSTRGDAVMAASVAPADARMWLIVQFWMVIAAALGGATLAGFGLQQRLREYR